MISNGGLVEMQILRKFDHYEVYVGGEFLCSADTITEAAKELEAHLEEVRKTEKWMEEFTNG